MNCEYYPLTCIALNHWWVWIGVLIIIIILGKKKGV